ncbi:MAG TPA: hydrogenase maturation protease [Dehalococcoidales bacterium]|nr:hydrogenase maturation protease [Dehalococcoidales bacterium]
MKTLVVGLGNPILSDDGVGLCVAAKLREIIRNPDVTVSESERSGMDLLEIFSGYDRVIVVDAILTKNGVPGTIHRFDPSSLKRSRHIETTHGLNFADSLETYRKLGLKLPAEIIIVAIESQDVSTFSEDCTLPVSNSIPACVELIAKMLE